MQARTIMFIALLAGAGCASGKNLYKVGRLPGAWDRIELAGGDVAYKHEGGGTIYANRMCKSVDDVPLTVLTNHLFFDMKVIKEMSRSELTLDGREALRTHVLAELDGVPVEVDVVVLKKDGCTYDMALVAGPDEFQARQEDFESFVNGFEQVT